MEEKAKAGQNPSPRTKTLKNICIHVAGKAKGIQNVSPRTKTLKTTHPPKWKGRQKDKERAHSKTNIKVSLIRNPQRTGGGDTQRKNIT